MRKNKYTLSLVMVTLLGTGLWSTLRGADPEEAEDVYAALMCNCGCNQVLGVCSHIGCPNAIPMRAEVDAYLDEGYDKESILALFRDKYGLSILAAPPTEGWFNVSAWVMPFLAVFAGLAALAYYIRRFRSRWSDPTPAFESASSATVSDQRLEDELADFVPED